MNITEKDLKKLVKMRFRNSKPSEMPEPIGIIVEACSLEYLYKVKVTLKFDETLKFYDSSKQAYGSFNQFFPDEIVFLQQIGIDFSKMNRG